MSKKSKKNPLKSGNPAIAAQARKEMEGRQHGTKSEPRASVDTKIPETKSTVGGFEPSATLFGDKEPVPKPAKSFIETRKSRRRKAGEMVLVMGILGGLILTSFAGLIGQQPVTPIQDQNNVLLDQNGNPIDGSGVSDSVEVGENLPPAVPSPVETEGVIELNPEMVEEAPVEEVPAEK